jgi:cytochrome c biogenesis protein CcdA
VRDTRNRGTWLAIAVAVVAVAARAPAAGVELDARWEFDASAVRPGGTIRAAFRYELSKKYHVNSDRPRDEYQIPTQLTVTAPPGLTVARVVYPDAIELKTQFSEEPLDVFESTFVIGVVLEAGDDLEPDAYLLDASLVYQACDDVMCLAPATHEMQRALDVVAEPTAITATASALFDGIDFSAAAATSPPPPARPVVPSPGAASRHDCDVMAEIEGFTVLGTAGGYLGRDDFIAFVDGAETGTGTASLLDGKGPLAIVLLVILGGIALNLTPCVLPLIPINLGIIGAGTQASSRGRGFLLGGAYGLAMAVVYGGLGLIVILTTGTFGAINSTIWFNVFVGILFVVLALAMFDVIRIDFSRFQSKLDVSRVSRRGTFVLAFAMGSVTALLAGACVAPVVIQVIVYSSDQYAKGTTVALGLPFFLGLGMALPWPLAGAGLALLPRPGAWMVRVEQALGVFILLCAGYYFYVAWEIFDARRVDRGLVAAAANEQLEEGWTDSICDGLAMARDQGKPVLVDMWATWCKNCLAMDKSTFKDDQVVARLEDYVKVKFQAEDLDAPPARDLIRRFEGVGLPTYAILQPLDPARDGGSQP